MRCRDPASERALRGLGLVDDRHQLEVGLAERHYPVGRAPAGVTTALDRSEAVPHFDLLRGCGKVGHRDQYVVEFQSYESSGALGVAAIPMTAEIRPTSAAAETSVNPNAGSASPTVSVLSMRLEVGEPRAR